MRLRLRGEQILTWCVVEDSQALMDYHYRMNQTMTKLSKMSEAEYTPLMRVLFGLSSPSPPDLSSLGDLQFIDPSLNGSQQEAIRFALASPEVALIHGSDARACIFVRFADQV